VFWVYQTKYPAPLEVVMPTGITTSHLPGDSRHSFDIKLPLTEIFLPSGFSALGFESHPH
jgi:hypothetical protein